MNGTQDRNRFINNMRWSESGWEVYIGENIFCARVYYCIFFCKSKTQQNSPAVKCFQPSFFFY